MRRLAVFATALLAASAVQAAELPIQGNFCSALMRLSAQGIKFEEGDCTFDKVTEAGPHKWNVSACKGDAAQTFTVAESKDAVALTYAGEEPYILSRCP